MKTENTLTFLGRLLDKVHPADLLLHEHRLTLSLRVEHLLTETGINRLQFGQRVRADISELRSWLTGARNLTHEALTDICGVFHITLGDLVLE